MALDKDVPQLSRTSAASSKSTRTGPDERAGGGQGPSSPLSPGPTMETRRHCVPQGRNVGEGQQAQIVLRTRGDRND